MASKDRLRLYGDEYPGIPDKFIRDLNRLFEARDARLKILEDDYVALEARVTSIEARLLAAGIP